MVLLVPVLFVITLQLSLSAVALLPPLVALIAYRARHVDWRAFVAGAAIGILLLSTWLAHNAKHGFRDFRLIVTHGRGHHGGAPGTGAIEAVRQTMHLVSAEGWSFLTGAQHQAGRGVDARPGGRDRRHRAARARDSDVARARRARRAPPDDRHRTPGSSSFGSSASASRTSGSRAERSGSELPDLVTYPVSFLLAALGLDDVAALVGRRSAAISLAAAATIAAAYVAFTLSFQAFVQHNGGAAGAYDVIYDDTAALAAAVRARGLHVDDPPAEYLVSGHLGAPAGTTRFVTTRFRLRGNNPPLPCAGQRRWFGPD